MSSLSRKDVRILLVGERGVGKTSLILSLVSEEFPEEVPPRAEEITIPADVTPEQVPTHIVDFSEGEQTESDLMKQLRMADVVCVVYAVDDEMSLKQVTKRWLPLIRKARATNPDGSAKSSEEDATIPVILVGNKIDLIDQGTMEVLLPIMNQYSEIETCVECSARTLRNVSELFYYAQKAVLHPIGPLYIVDEKELTEKCKKALSRIFKICDRDGDNALNDVELNAFQSRCFGTALQPRALEDVRAVVRRSIPDGVDDRGLTLKGFLFLHCLFIQRGRHETTWTVLRKFGYDDHLQLSRDYLFPQLRVPPGCSTELSNAGINFLTELFLRHDLNKDRALNPQELAALFAPCPVAPWGKDLQRSVVTNSKGWVTLEGFLAQWALTTLLDVRRTCELLAYLGYHTAGEDSQLSAIHVTRDKKVDLAKRQTSRQVFMCHVIGPKGAGKSTFCQAMLGKSVEDFNSLSFAELPRYVAGIVPVYGQQKYLVLQDIDVISLADTLSPAQVHCDVACLLYNAADPHSFEHVARLYLKYFAESKTPVLIVGSQMDRGIVRQEYLVQPEAFCRRNRLPPPQSFASTSDHTQDIFVKLATMAVYPRFKAAWFFFRPGRNWRQMGIKNLPLQTWFQAAVGLAAFSALGFFMLRALHRLKV